MFNSLFGFPDFSFPSTHVAVAFCVLAITDEAFKGIRWTWLTLGVLVAVSRMYLGMHYFSDVTFGAFIGYTIGFLCVELSKMKGVKEWNEKVWK